MIGILLKINLADGMKNALSWAFLKKNCGEVESQNNLMTLLIKMQGVIYLIKWIHLFASLIVGLDFLKDLLTFVLVKMDYVPLVKLSIILTIILRFLTCYIFLINVVSSPTIYWDFYFSKTFIFITLVSCQVRFFRPIVLLIS